jgi:hypothetical protein
MLNPEPSQINWQALLLLITLYAVVLYFAVNHFSNKKSDNAENL